MKKCFVLLAVLCLGLMHTHAQNTFPATGSVGIGTTTPASSSLLEMRSTTKGFLAPKMTAAQKTAIASPVSGLLIYQTDGTAGYYYYDGAAWKQLLNTAASTSLNNLSPTTSVNRSLLTQVTGSLDIGSATRKWLKGFFTDSVSVKTLIATDSNYTGIKTYGGLYGIYASSKNNYGVAGSSGYIGIYGTGGMFGVYGYGTTYGVYGSGAYGLYGSGSTYGVYGVGYAFNYGAVYGNGTAAFGVAGNSTNNYGGYFTSTNLHGIYAKTSSTASSVYAAVFQGNTYAYGSYLSSDENIKKNINDVSSGMSLINQLKPKTYEFRSDANYGNLRLPKGAHFGLLAQDVEKLFPGLVREAPLEIQEPKEVPVPQPGPLNPGDPLPKPEPINIETMQVKGINYIELMPVMIKGMQELDAENKSLKEELAELKQQVKELILKTNGSNNALSLSNASLEQNQPNPFSGKTIIPVNIPAGAKQAILNITETGSGKLLKRINVVAGARQVNVDAGTLSSGSYTYTLVVDGKKIDSRQMTLVK